MYGNRQVEIVFKFKDKSEKFLELTNNFTVSKIRGGIKMAYKEFISKLQKKLEEKKQDLGYNKITFLEDGATSSDAEELSIIRETNIKYHRTESQIL